MNIIVLVGAFIKLVYLILQNKFEKDKKLREKKEKILEGISDGIKKKDVSSISLNFDRINRLR